MYRNLKDASDIDLRYAGSRFSIFYATSLRDYSFGQEVAVKEFGAPSPKRNVTHKLLGTIDASCVDEAWQMMQGEFWSPRGEASTMIKLLGIGHTSMAVGDVVLDNETGEAHFVECCGFSTVEDF